MMNSGGESVLCHVLQHPHVVISTSHFKLCLITSYPRTATMPCLYAATKSQQEIVSFCESLSFLLLIARFYEL